jgi:hypothetical protein
VNVAKAKKWQLQKVKKIGNNKTSNNYKQIQKLQQTQPNLNPTPDFTKYSKCML